MKKPVNASNTDSHLNRGWRRMKSKNKAKMGPITGFIRDKLFSGFVRLFLAG